MQSTLAMMLDYAKAERDTLEVKLYMDSCPWWVAEEVRTELDRQNRIIEDCEVRLGLRHYVGFMGRRWPLITRLLRWVKKRFRR